MRWERFFASSSPGFLAALGILMVLLVGLIDFVTGAEISIAIFYLVPIGFVTWFAGRAPGLIIAVLSAGAWLAADLANDPAYSHPAIPFWNCAVRLGIFVLVAWLLAAIRNLTGHLEHAVQKKTALLDAEIRTRKELEKEMAELTTHQRRLIAYELHDGLCPFLAGTALKAKILHDTLAEQLSPDAGAARELVSLLKQANQQARLLARGLDPIAVELHGLTAALHKLAADTEELSRVRCIFDTDLDGVPVNPSSALELYRIAQEAIRNAVRHGQARSIKLELSNGGTDLRLKITDDGTGFCPEPTPEGLGLRIMRFRTECIGAVLRVESRPNQGTTIECCLPNFFPALENVAVSAAHDQEAVVP